MAKSKADIKIIEVCKEEKRLIKIIRSLRYGEIKIMVRGSKPYQIIESRKSVLLSDDGIFDGENNQKG